MKILVRVKVHLMVGSKVVIYIFKSSKPIMQKVVVTFKV